MPDTQKGSPAPTEGKDNLLAAYQAACSRHQQIDEFRGKLLALLPIASGAAGLLLLKNSGTFEKYLTPIGIYGFAVTFGLSIYELYGISVCKRIIDQAGDLEKKLCIPEPMGQYKDRQRNKPWQRLLEAEMASWVVYLSVLAGWVYIAGINGWWHHVPSWIIIITVAAFLSIRGAAIASLGWRRERQLRKTGQSGSGGEERAADTTIQATNATLPSMLV